MNFSYKSNWTGTYSLEVLPAGLFSLASRKKSGLLAVNQAMPKSSSMMVSAQYVWSGMIHTLPLRKSPKAASAMISKREDHPERL